MHTYCLYLKKNGQKSIATESRSPFPPEDERGQATILHLYKLAQKVGLSDGVGVSLLTKEGGRMWFDQAGRVVDEDTAFGA